VEDIAADSSGNTFVTGYSYRGMPWKHSDYYTVKYDSSGNEEWDVRYDGQRNGNDEALAIAIDASYVYVTGRSQQSKGDEKNYDYYTAKYDIDNGKKRWDFRYDGPGESDDEAAAVAVDNSGNVCVTGRSTGDGTGFDYYTAKYDSSGDLVWEARYNNDSVNGNDEARGIAVDSSGNVYITGRSTGDDSSFDYYTIKYAAADGAKLWDARYAGPGSGDDEARAIVVDSSGNAYVTGRSEGSGTDYDYYTVKYAAADGEALWAKPYNNDDKDGHDEATAMTIDASGDIYVTGRSKGSGTGFDYYTIKYFSDDGRRFWVARYNNEDENGEDQAWAIVVDSSGNVYVTGSSQGSGTSIDYATVKYKQ
jgi:hypothetical protein